MLLNWCLLSVTSHPRKATFVDDIGMGAFAFDRVCVFFFACIESIFGLVPLVMRTTAVAFQPRVGSEI